MKTWIAGNLSGGVPQKILHGFWTGVGIALAVKSVSWAGFIISNAVVSINWKRALEEAKARPADVFENPKRSR